MIKVMIVDDEILVRLALRASIDWQAYQLELVAEAEDGVQAIEYIEKFRPDIIITDISMPRLTGTELIKYTKDKYPDIEFVVLSCHNEYEYVREAMKLGAVDYILKLSMDIHELMIIVSNLREKILEKFENKEDVTKDKTNDKWHQLILEVLNNQEITIKVDELMFDVETEKFVVAIFEADKSKDKSKSITVEVNRSIRSIIEDVYGLNEHIMIIDIELDKCLIVFRYGDEEEYSKLYREYLSKCKKIIELTASYLELDISCGISEMVKGYRAIKEAYTQAYRAIKHKFYLGKRSISIYKEKELIEKSIIDTEIYERLLQHINSLHKQDIQNDLNNLFDVLETKKEINSRIVKRYLHEILLYLSRSASDFLGSTITFKSVQEGYHKVNEALYLNQARDEMNECINDFWKEFEELCKNTYRKEIVLAKHYILLNYNRGINITKVSEHVNLSSDYFSHLFKKEMDISFSTYLNELRIEKAKSYMSREDLKVYEIAYKVGYENESYFIKKFKQIVGITPVEYIKQVRK